MIAKPWKIRFTSLWNSAQVVCAAFWVWVITGSINIRWARIPKDYPTTYTKFFPDGPHKVAIAYDCRHQSDTLAQLVAEVFSANGIQVYLFSALRPTPELSFAVKHLGCVCGIVLTASHNPPEYNGYKVYWQDGGQLVPPQDAAIIQRINALEYSDINFNARADRIHLIDQEVDDAFAATSLKAGDFGTSANAKSDLKIVFTSLHGTSITMIPRVLEAAGYAQVHIVEEQAEPNGDFPTVESPNPEEPAALQMALDLAERVQADIVIGTDPDCDRLGIAARDAHGGMKLLNGNQAMVLKSHFILKSMQGQNRLHPDQFMASTIVSTPMMKEVVESFGVQYKEGLTGFKWIAKMIKDYPKLEFLGGGEESFGFMVGDFVRDKDAVTSTLLACEMAAQVKASGSDLWSYLDRCYQAYGYYQERLVSMVKKGKQGAEEIQAMLDQLRNNSPQLIAGSAVVQKEDYLLGEITQSETDQIKPTGIPTSNVLIFHTEDGSKIAARPSGTEPKIKFYISVRGASVDGLNDRIDAILKDLNIA